MWSLLYVSFDVGEGLVLGSGEGDVPGSGLLDGRGGQAEGVGRGFLIVRGSAGGWGV